MSDTGSSSLEELKKEYEHIVKKLDNDKRKDEEEAKRVKRVFKGDKEKLRTPSKHGSSIKQNMKLNDLSWYPADKEDNAHLCMCLQDGKLIIYNVRDNGMRFYVALDTWLQTCEFSPSGKRIATGGLDNMVSIFGIPDLNEQTFDACPSEAPMQLIKHTGPVYSTKWLDENTVLSSSGDDTVMIWDANGTSKTQKEPTSVIKVHQKDVTCLATRVGESNLFLTGSGDRYCKMIDKRLRTAEHSGSTATFCGHRREVRDIKWFHEHAFGSASEDGSFRIWDIRTHKQMSKFDGGDDACSSIAFSKSGRLLYGGYDCGMIKVYDCLSGSELCGESTYKHHAHKVKAMELSKEGFVLATCSQSKEEKNNFALWA